jgi:hypothetical protein
MRSLSKVANKSAGLFGALALVGALAASGARGEDFETTVPVEPGGRLEVELSEGSIAVETHHLPEVRIDARASGWASNAVRFALEHDEDELRLTGFRSSWFPGLGPGHVKVRVRIPDLFSVDLRTSGGDIDVAEVTGEVEASTSGGGIELQQIVGGVEVETSGGSIKGREIRGDVEAKTSGGSVHLSEVKGDVEAKTSGGPIRIHDVDGHVEAKTSGGSISVRFTGAPAGELKTSGGSIQVEFPQNQGVDLEAQTGGGRVAIDEAFAVTGVVEQGHVEAKLDGGGADLTLETSGGNIRVGVR